MFREGAVTKINPSELVVGDIVQLKYGDKVPADIRCFDPDNFKVHTLITCFANFTRWLSFLCCD